MALIDDLKKQEGFRSTAYKCSEGYDTIGYGFAIKDLVLSKEISTLILSEKLLELQTNINKKFDWFKDSPRDVQDVVTNMC